MSHDHDDFRFPDSIYCLVYDLHVLTVKEFCFVAGGRNTIVLIEGIKIMEHRTCVNFRLRKSTDRHSVVFMMGGPSKEVS